MPKIENTRLRYIIAPSEAELSAAIDSLPFKVEIKSIVNRGDNSLTAFFVLPEIEGLRFDSVDLRGL